MLYVGLRTEPLSKRLYSQLFFLKRILLTIIIVVKSSYGVQASLLITV